jgi:hypothetical protein
LPRPVTAGRLRRANATQIDVGKPALDSVK